MGGVTQQVFHAGLGQLADSGQALLRGAGDGEAPQHVIGNERGVRPFLQRLADVEAGHEPPDSGQLVRRHRLGREAEVVVGAVGQARAHPFAGAVAVLVHADHARHGDVDVGRVPAVFTSPCRDVGLRPLQHVEVEAGAQHDAVGVASGHPQAPGTHRGHVNRYREPARVEGDGAGALLAAGHLDGAPSQQLADGGQPGGEIRQPRGLAPQPVGGAVAGRQAQDGPPARELVGRGRGQGQGRGVSVGHGGGGDAEAQALGPQRAHGHGLEPVQVVQVAVGEEQGVEAEGFGRHRPAGDLFGIAGGAV